MKPKCSGACPVRGKIVRTWKRNENNFVSFEATHLTLIRVRVRVKIQPHANETKMQWGMSCEGNDCQNWKRNENNFVSFEATHLT